MRETARPWRAAAAGDWRELFAERDFVRLWLGQAVSQIGDGLSALVLVVVLYQRTGSAGALAGFTILTSLPQVLLGLHAGVIADRWERRRLLVASDLARGAIVALLALAIEKGPLWALFALAVAHAVVSVLFEPARAALLPRLVAPERLMAANGIGSSTRVACTAAGAALGGLLLALRHGAALALGLDAASFGIAALAVAAIRGGAVANAQDPAPEPGAGVRGLRADLMEGVDLVLRDPVLAPLLLTFGVTVVGMSAMGVLFVPFLMRDLHAPTGVIGLMRGVQLAGLVGGGLWLARRSVAPGAAALLTAGILGLAPLLVAVAFAPSWMWVVPWIALCGACSNAIQSGSATLLQQATPDRLRGRAESAFDTVLVAVSIGATAAAGWTADHFGVRTALAGAGVCVTLGGAVGVARLLPRERARAIEEAATET